MTLELNYSLVMLGDISSINNVMKDANYVFHTGSFKTSPLMRVFST